MNTDWDNLADAIHSLDSQIKRDKRKIKKLKKQIKKNKCERDELWKIYCNADGLLSKRDRDSEPRNYDEFATWNPISEAHEFTLSGRMICVTSSELLSAEAPHMPYYLCDVELMNPNGLNAKVEAYIWSTTASHHEYLLEAGANISLLVQIVHDNEIYLKVNPSRIDVSKLLSPQQLAEIRGSENHEPLSHADKWWNRIPLRDY